VTNARETLGTMEIYNKSEERNGWNEGATYRNPDFSTLEHEWRMNYDVVFKNANEFTIYQDHAGQENGNWGAKANMDHVQTPGENERDRTGEYTGDAKTEKHLSNTNSGII
jgi:hypothetical protein